MSTRHLLDPELAVAVDQLPLIPPLSRETLQARRAARVELMAMALPKLPEIAGVAVTERRVPGASGAPDVRLLIHRKEDAQGAMPVLLWIHGGGYVDGSADWDSHLAKVLVRETGCCVVAVDYRLAPETQFPGAIDDCYAALQWAHLNATELGIDPTRIGVGGLSAGAGLAAALALLARDRGQYKLSFQMLLQPMLDDRNAVDGYHHPYAGEYIWTRGYNHFGWSALLGHEPGVEGVSPYAAPARAGSLADLPPAFISVGSLDLFVEENIEYARRLIRDGVATELHVHPGACHVFQVLAPQSSVARLHDYNFINALRRAIDPVA